MSEIFLSHSSLDNETAARLKEWLREQGHGSVFLDFDPGQGIPPGRNWEQELYRQLKSCRAVVVLCSDHSTASRWCFAEITQARSHGKSIIPVKVPRGAVDPILKDLQIIDLEDGAEEAHKRLVWALAAAGVDTRERFAWDSERSPYPGFLAFEEEDAAIFFGREREIGGALDALRRVRRQGSAGLVMILGSSGAGKSSLLRAGLLPRLRRDQQHWLIVGPFKPGGEPIRELAGALAQALRGVGVTRDWRELHKALDGWQGPDADAPNPVVEAADDLRLSSARPDARVLVVIDQFEELLGHPPDHPSTRFLSLMRDGTDGPGGPLLAIATMRSDFLAELQQHPELIGLEFGSLTLGPMPAENLVEVIEGPAGLVGLEVEAGLAQAMLADAKGRGSLPLVAFTLRELYSQYGEQGKLTARHYREGLGGLSGAVAKVVASVLDDEAELSAIESDLRDSFLRMVRVNEEGHFARLPMAWKDLPTSVHSVFERFAAARLLTFQGEDGGRTVEIAHETLFTAWDRLALWLEESREALLVRREVSHATSLWSDRGKAEEYLWKRGRLQRALELWDDGRLPIDAAELAFLEASREAEQRAERLARRRRRLLFAAVSVVAIVTTVLSIVAFRAEQTAHRQRARAEIQAAKSLAMRVWGGSESQLDQALLLATEAASTLQRLGAPADQFVARSALFHLLLQSPGLAAFLHGHQDNIWTLAYHPEGRWLASGSSDGRLLLWDVGARQAVRNLDHCDMEARPPDAPVASCGERVKSLDFSPDGSWLVSGSEKGKVLIWNATTFELERRLQVEGPVVEHLAVSPDGGTIATTGDPAGTLRIWHLADGTSVDLPGHQGWATRVAFLPDGQSLLSASSDKTIRLWDLASGTGRTVHTAAEAIYSLSVAPDGTVAAGFADGSIRAWQEALDRPLWQRPAAHQGEVRDLAFSPDGALLASASFDGTAKIWQAATGDEHTELGGHVRGVGAVAFSRLDGTVATAAGDGKLRLWDLAATAPRSKLTEHTSRLVSVAFGGGTVATGGLDGMVRLTRLADWQDLPSIAIQEDEVWGLSFSPDRRYLANTVGSRAVRIWDLQGRDPATGGLTVRLLHEFLDHTFWLWQSEFSADGATLASSDEAGNLQLRSVADGVASLSLRPSGSIQSLAFGPEVQAPILAVGRKTGALELWDPVTGQRLEELPGHENQIKDLAFSRDGSQLASASLDGSVRLWHLGADGTRAGPVLQGRESGVKAVVFSADGRSVAWGNLNGEVRVSDALTGDPKLGIRAHQGQVLKLGFDEAGWLVSGGEDRMLRRWEIGIVDTLQAAAERACVVANRRLDSAELEQFLGDPEYAQSCPE